MCRNKVPQPGTRILIDEDHILDVEYFVGDPVDDVAVRFAVLIIIDRSHDVVRIPEPVLVPCQLVPDDRAVRPLCEALISPFQFLILRLYPAHITAYLMIFRQLIVLNLIGNLIRDDLPALSPVIRNRIWIQIADILSALPHVFQCLLQKLVHQSHVRVLRIGTDTGQASHCVLLSENPHLHRIDRTLRNEIVSIKPADDICFFHCRKFRPDDLLLLPSDRAQFLIGHLKHIAQKRIVLFHIFTAY